MSVTYLIEVDIKSVLDDNFSNDLILKADTCVYMVKLCLYWSNLN